MVGAPNHMHQRKGGKIGTKHRRPGDSLWSSSDLDRPTKRRDNLATLDPPSSRIEKHQTIARTDGPCARRPCVFCAHLVSVCLLSLGSPKRRPTPTSHGRMLTRRKKGTKAKSRVRRTFFSSRTLAPPREIQRKSAVKRRMFRDSGWATPDKAGRQKGPRETLASVLFCALFLSSPRIIIATCAVVCVRCAVPLFPLCHPGVVDRQRQMVATSLRLRVCWHFSSLFSHRRLSLFRPPTTMEGKKSLG